MHHSCPHATVHPSFLVTHRLPKFSTFYCAEMKFTAVLPLMAALLLVGEKQRASFRLVLDYENETNVFIYLSNAKNLPVLNPTILSLKVVQRTDEEYSIEYMECLSRLPMVTHTGKARYKMRKGRFGGHELESAHSTCFMGKIFCLRTTTGIRVNKTQDMRVLYEEDIYYMCPRILTPFCITEILFQRMTIMEGLLHVFTKPKGRLPSKPGEFS